MFEDFTLATSKILNKQVDFSIDLVSKRSQEVAKILSSKNSEETLNRLDTQVELTAVSISQISDPVERKKAAEEYIIKLNEASVILSEKEKELLTDTNTNLQIQPTLQPTVKSFEPESTIAPTVMPTTASQIAAQPTSQPTLQPTVILPTPTTAPVSDTTNVSQQINNSQTTIQQTIAEMKTLATIDNRDFKKEHKPEQKKEPTKKPDAKNIKDKTVEEVKKLKNKMSDDE